jgi:hypothetical protein
MAKTPEELKAPAPKLVKGKNIPEDAIQLVSCEVATGPNHETIVKRSVFRPVSFPETAILDRLHMQPGKPEAVRRVAHAGYATRSMRAEKKRLVQKYGSKIVEQVFPGQQPQMERFNKTDAPTPGTKCTVGDFVNVAEEAAIEPDPAD